MVPADSDYCLPPTWLERCPKSSSGTLAMIEIPLLAHFRLVSDKSNISSLNLIVGYGYGITSGSYEEIEFENETRTSGELIEYEVDNPHILSAVLKFRHYLFEKATFSLGCWYRNLTNITENATDGMDLSHFLYSLKFGVDFCKKK